MVRRLCGHDCASESGNWEISNASAVTCAWGNPTFSVDVKESDSANDAGDAKIQ